MPGNTMEKEEPGNLSPKSVLNCAVMTVAAAAEQKPEMTGPDMNSIIHPENMEFGGKNKFKGTILLSVKSHQN